MPGTGYRSVYGHSYKEVREKVLTLTREPCKRPSLLVSDPPNMPFHNLKIAGISGLFPGSLSLLKPLVHNFTYGERTRLLTGRRLLWGQKLIFRRISTAK